MTKRQAKKILITGGWRWDMEPAYRLGTYLKAKERLPRHHSQWIPKGSTKRREQKVALVLQAEQRARYEAEHTSGDERETPEWISSHSLD